MHKVLKIATLLTITLFALMFASVAFATDGITIPHGGYDISTNACLSCHDIHEALGDYVLMREDTVTNTCGTCHDTYKTTGVPWDNPSGYKGDTPGTASGLAVYEIDEADRFDKVGGHRLGLNEFGSSDLGFADMPDSDGEDANYIPGGVETLTAIDNLNFGEYTDATDFAATDGLYCASCHTPHGEFGQIARETATTDTNGDGDITYEDGAIPADSRLQLSKPNHSDTEVTIDDWGSEAGTWCVSCHENREYDPGIVNNHDDQFCVQCHDNYAGQIGAGTDVGDFPSEDEITEDFPHSSPAQNLLSAEPDELCLTCHQSGDLP